jgi:cell division GTPase FtsZ
MVINEGDGNMGFEEKCFPVTYELIEKIASPTGLINIDIEDVLTLYHMDGFSVGLKGKIEPTLDERGKIAVENLGFESPFDFKIAKGVALVIEGDLNFDDLDQASQALYNLVDKDASVLVCTEFKQGNVFNVKVCLFGLPVSLVEFQKILEEKDATNPFYRSFMGRRLEGLFR